MVTPQDDMNGANRLAALPKTGRRLALGGTEQADQTREMPDESLVDGGGLGFGYLF